MSEQCEGVLTCCARGEVEKCLIKLKKFFGLFINIINIISIFFWLIFLGSQHFSPPRCSLNDFAVARIVGLDLVEYVRKCVDETVGFSTKDC